MPPRTYLPDRSPRLHSVPKPVPQAEIPVEAKLYSLREASAILTELYGDGYSVYALTALIDSGDWIEGVHWCDRRRKNGKNRQIKIYLEAVKRWQVSRHSDR